jgi:hypothetical protein
MFSPLIGVSADPRPTSPASRADPGRNDMVQLRSRPLFRLTIDLHPTIDMGATPYGQRRIFPVAGGRFEGDRLRGLVVPNSGQDWLLVRQDGAAQQDVRLLLRTDDDAMIFMTYRGVNHAPPEVNARRAAGEAVDRGEYYLRTTPNFETSAEKYAWINQIVAVAMGERTNGPVGYDVFEIL